MPTGLRPKNRPNLKVACILNDPMVKDLQHECELLLLSAYSWKEQLCSQKPEFLFCESILESRSGQWPDGEAAYEEITLLCRELGIPTVFWDTSDASVFRNDKKVAVLFDYLFVTNSGSMKLYREAGRPDVYWLPSGIQILNYSPVKAGSFHEHDAMMTKAELLLLRENITSNAYSRRIGIILEAIGIKDSFSNEPGVSVITSTNKPGYMQKIFENYDRQNYGKKEMIVILNNNSLDLDEWKARAVLSKDVEVVQVDEREPLGRCLNFGIKNSRYPYITKMDDDNYYAPEFLTDLMNAYQFTNADIVGKLSYYVYLEGCQTLILMCPGMENRYVNFVSGSALIMKREIFDDIKFSDVPTGSDSVFLDACVRKGITIYSTDRFNYVYGRRASKKDHTYQISDQVYLQSCQYVGQMACPESFVTV
jgi:hypothetical protein